MLFLKQRFSVKSSFCTAIFLIQKPSGQFEGSAYFTNVTFLPNTVVCGTLKLLHFSRDHDDNKNIANDSVAGFIVKERRGIVTEAKFASFVLYLRRFMNLYNQGSIIFKLDVKWFSLREY